MEEWKPSTAFSAALKEYISQPTNSRRKIPIFIQRVLDGKRTTPDDVNEELQKLESETSQRTTRRVLRHVFNAISNYSGVIGVLCQADPYPSALVWGGLKAVIECFHRYSDVFKRLVGQLDALAQQLDRLKHYEALFSASEDMMDLIVFSYKSIIRFWITVEDQCRAPAYKLALKSLTSFNTTKVEEIVADVNSKIDNIEKYLPIIQEQTSRRDKEDATRQRAQAQTTLSRILQTLSEDREEVKRRQFYDWIGGTHGSILSDNNASRHKRRLGRQLKGTGQWLLEDYHFKHWIEPDSGSNILWLRGGAGVGKSIICSHAISELERLHPRAAIASHFFSFDEKETPMDIYRSLAMQLYESLYGETGEISERLSSLLRFDVAKQLDLQKVIKALLLEANRAFIFVDGLDEQCEDLKKNKRWDQFSDIVSFLNSSAYETEVALKLWYSSQDNHSIRDLLSGTEEIQLGAAINSNDIERFLTSSLTSTQFLEIDNSIKDTILKSLKKKVNGSFLWASLMINVIKEAPTVRHIFQIVDEGLPDDFETYLQRLISRYPHSNHEFIRRPLLIDELCEAIEIYRTKPGENIDPAGRVLRSQLQDSLGPLIRIENITASSKKQICSLSHAAVKKLLESKPDILSHKAACQISPNILAQGCLKYLQQPRYRHLLKVGTQTIATECGSSIETHALLEYAAKYWHTHLDEIQYSQATGDEVINFVCSPNFRTCLQVQSLFFGRQFHIRHTNRGHIQEIQLFKPFPRWLVTEHTDGMRRQNEYNDAIIEWSHFLSRHSTYQGSFKGDVSRCLWSTLGANNFLNKFPTNFKCFVLEKFRSEGPEQAGLIFDRVSLDGLEIDLMRLEEPMSHANDLQLKIERWAVKRGSSRPKKTGTQVLAVDRKDLQLYYGKLTKGVPERAPMVESTRNGGLLRIGSRLYSGAPGGKPCFRMIQNRGDVPAYMETTACNDRYCAVASRGRISPKDLKDETMSPLGAPRHISRQSTLRDDGSKEDSGLDSDCSSSSASSHGGSVGSEESVQKHRPNDGSEIQAPDSDTDSVNLHPCPSSDNGEEASDWSDTTSSTHSAELSWSEGSTAFQSDEAQEPMRGFEDGYDSGSDNELNDVDSVDQKFLENDEGLSEDSLEKMSESVSSLRSVRTLDMLTTYNVESESSDDSDDSTSSDDSDSTGSSRSDGDEDVQNARRKLESILGNRRNGHKGPLCEVLVFRLDTNDDVKTQRLFRFRQRMSCRLYASPPVFHPTQELLVWPLGDCKILFADFIHKKYFIRTISKSKPKGCQVSVQCNFSPCGQYLHVASLQGVKMRFTGGESRLGLRLIVSTHRLSKRKLVRSPPRMVYQTSVNLAKKLFDNEELDVMNLPTVLTWGVNHLYVAEKSLEFLVHRLPLFKDVERKDRTPESPRGVVRNMGNLFLPKSAESRKVHFFVVRDDDDGPAGGVKATEKHTTTSSKDKYTAHVLLGAQNEGGTPEWVRGASRIVFAPKMAPQGVHLTQEQLGDWGGDIRTQGAITNQNNDHWEEAEVTSMLERFESVEDFEFVPYLHH